ncbi:MAG TPA: AMP-binding protein [Opitutaceae bacterium]|jgi:acyl-[acyl-carrier-protein]-phospholipid O-acyltransferase/long-chain-fatty-acid--[acyl-carrier-protein] ligase
MRRLSTLPLWIEIPAILVARTLYRVRVLGAALVPAQGGAVLVANHLSYVDAAVLQLACPRPLRFLAFLSPETGGFVRWIYRLAGAIPVSEDRSTLWFRAAVAALKRGELVCLFPEGGISRTGQLMKLRRGFEILARHGGVAVVPAAIDGLWGSVFSFAGNKYLWKSPRLTPTPVCVAFGAPIPAERADTGAVRQALMELGAEAFAERPVLRRHIGREIVRGLARRPGSVAVIDRTGGRRVVRAATLVAASAVLARRLRRTVPERRVGIVLPPGAGAAIANLAVVCAGKIPVNLNFTAGRTAVESSLAAAGVRTVISADALRPRLPDFPWPERTRDLRAEIQAEGGVRALLPWLAALWLLPNQWVAGLLGLPRTGDRDEAVLLFTSGSAGDPKGVVLSHRNLLANFAQISSMSILPSSATMLGCLPIFHSFGFTVTLGYPLLRGCRLVTIPSPLDTRAVIDAIRDEKVTVLVGAPTFLRPLMKKAVASDLRSLDLVVSGAEKLPEDLRTGFLERFHIEILQGYGLTETSPVSNVNQPNPPMTTPTADPQKGKKAGTVGRLLPGMAARSVHPESGETLPFNETGVLWLRGANVFSHYLDDEGATASAVQDCWFVTRDLGRIDEEGFVTVEGRVARFSKIGGEMVPHGTIEQRLSRLLGLDPGEAQSVVVVGVPDEAKGEKLVVLSTSDLTAAEVRDGLAAAGFPNLWIPRIVLRVSAIPFLGAGKLDLAACRRLALEAKG